MKLDHENGYVFFFCNFLFQVLEQRPSVMSSRIETIENRLRLENSVFPMVFLYFFLAKITSSSKEIEKNEEINPFFSNKN